MRILAVGVGLIGLLGAGLCSQAASAQAVSYTATQALRGLQAFNENCMRCHGPAARGGEGPPLSGPRFDEKWRGKPAKALWDHLSNNMPYDNPGTLGKDTYVSILAYLLQLNSVAAGQQALVEDPPGVIPGR